MELSLILKSIDILGIENIQVKHLINDSKYIIYDTFDKNLSKYFIHFNPISTLKLKSNVDVDFDFICNVLKPTKIEHENDIAFNNLFAILCHKGYIEVVDFILSCESPLDISYDDNQFLAAAVENGHLDIAVSLIKHGAIPQDDYIINLACQEGQLEVVKFLYEYGIIFPPQSMIFASIRGHLPVVKFLRKKCKIDISEQAVKKAIYTNNMELLKYFLRYCPPSTYMMIAALASANSELIDFLYYQEPHQYDWKQIFLYSISVKNIEMFEKLLNNIEIDDDIMNAGYTLCCKSDNIEFCKELILKTLFVKRRLYYHSIINHSIYILKYLITNIGDLDSIDEDLICFIIENNMCSVFELLIDGGLKVKGKYILLSNDTEMIKLFLIKFQIKEKYRCKLLKKMVNQKNVEIIKILMAQNTPVSEKIMKDAINQGNIECIKFLSCKYVVTKEILIQIIKSGQSFEIFILLYRLYNFIHSELIDAAIKYGNTRVVQFFLSFDLFNEKRFLEIALKYNQIDVAKIIIKKF